MNEKHDARRIVSEIEGIPGAPKNDPKTVELVEKMLRAKPETTLSPAFLERLRSKLLAEAEYASAGSDPVSKWANFVKFLSVPLALAGIAAIVSTLGLFERPSSPAPTPMGRVTDTGAPAPEAREAAPLGEAGKDSGNAALPQNTPPPTVTAPAPKSTPTPKSETSRESAAPEISTKPEEDRSLVEMDDGISRATGDSAPDAADNSTGDSAEGFASPLSMSAPADSSLKMAVPNAEAVSYRYAFSGSLPQTEGLPAYRRTVEPATAKFANVGTVGLAVSTDAENGWTSLYRDYEKWPETLCSDESCRLKASDVPADAELVSIAAKFAADWKIDLAGYGTPQIDSSWKNALPQTSDPTSAIIPESVTVTYPKKVGGIEVVDESGYPQGLAFSVDVRTKRISGAYGIDFARYGNADAGVPKTEKEIVAELTATDQSGSGKTVEIPMSKTRVAYLRAFGTENGKSVETLVPAVLFETSKTPKPGEYFRTKIAVPAYRTAN